ncbi:esterase [Oryctes borbonicus]|uniref:Carboxylic ester hydrolase n=1 Tax=Oryctes borbonicus TaxID=1629725 RepID=A0A0T6B5G4_9SCAR|nr:esterase [Oryctes borbonicus]
MLADMDVVMIEFKPIIVLLILYCTGVTCGDEISAPLIEISNGWLQGTFEKSYNGRLYSSFQGIPYAKPPIGELRFQPPKEPYNWTGTWIADTKQSCMYHTGSEITGDEDCLYLNVFVPREKINPSDNLNVFVHIHGGGFLIWNANYYAGPKYLMDEDVVFVTMNYRLGAFGFLSTGDDVVAGNNGLKDQVLALEWIQKNIIYFGGNPDSVTITGMSAGSVCTHLHYFSPLSRGLFHRGVSQSGTALDYWAFEESPLKKAEDLGQKVGCPIDSTKDLRDCLLTRSAKEIVNSQQKFLSADKREGPSFRPTIEKEHDGAFLTEHPYKLLENGNIADVPWIVATNEGEGNFMIALSTFTVSQFFEKFNEIAPSMLGYDDVEDDKKQAITDAIKKHYSQGHGHLHEDATTLNEILTDRMFLSSADKAAKLQAKMNKSPVYFYIFGYRGQHSSLDHVLPETDHIGPAHGDDVLYYLHSRVAEEKLSEADERMKSVFLQWLINYADTDEPKIDGVNWTPVSGNKIILEFLYFGSDGIFDEVGEGLGANALWNRLSLGGYKEADNVKDEL